MVGSLNDDDRPRHHQSPPSDGPGISINALHQSGAYDIIHIDEEDDEPQTKVSRKRDRPADGEAADTDSGTSEPQRRITFEEVYHNTRYTDDKNEIVKWPPRSNKYWIVPCRECGENWRRGFSLVAAGGHLKGKKHNLPCRDAKTVIEKLGIRVECSANEAAKNNAMFMEFVPKKPDSRKAKQKSHGTAAPALGVGQLMWSLEQDEDADYDSQPQPGGKGGDDDANDGQVIVTASTNSPDPNHPIQELPRDEVISEPALGQIYQCWWADKYKHKTGWYYVTRLPFGEYGWIGITGNLYQSTLCTRRAGVPPCYRTDPEGDGTILGWAAGFAGGEAQAMEREMPFLFLEPNGE